MVKIIKWIMAATAVIILCIAGGSLLIYLRVNEHACADYTYQDAAEYVERGLSRNALRSRSVQDNFLANTRVCSAQTGDGSKQFGGPYDPYIVNICANGTEEVVAFAEVYSDCGLEWRRKVR